MNDVRRSSQESRIKLLCHGWKDGEELEIFLSRVDRMLELIKLEEIRKVIEHNF